MFFQISATQHKGTDEVPEVHRTKRKSNPIELSVRSIDWNDEA
jgi:hypothetical protein